MIVTLAWAIAAPVRSATVPCRAVVAPCPQKSVFTRRRDTNTRPADLREGICIPFTARLREVFSKRWDRLQQMRPGELGKANAFAFTRCQGNRFQSSSNNGRVEACIRLALQAPMCRRLHCWV